MERGKEGNLPIVPTSSSNEFILGREENKLVSLKAVQILKWVSSYR